MGMRPERDAALLRNRLISLAVVLGLLIPIFIALISLTNRANRIHDIENALQHSFDPAEVIEVEVNSDEEPLQVIATIRAAEDPRADILRDAEAALVEVLNERVELKVIVLRLVEP
jgi:CO/xanthine dehydrogenase FAD-binding subunit